VKAVLSPASRQDVRNIVLYIAARNPGRARSFGDELRSHCHGIGKAALAYPLTPALGDGVRCARHGAYLILYRVCPDHVRILRVVHGAQLIDAEMLRGS
jgi:toxin ParE1/3/4